MTTAAPEQDLVVIGGGISGLTAGARAAELGLRVTVLEQGAEPDYPCNARFSGGIIHASYRDVMRPAEELVDAIQTMTKGTSREPLARAVATDGRRLVSWLQERGIRFMRFSQLEAHKWCMAPPRAMVAGLDWRGRGPDVMLKTLTAQLQAKGGTLVLGARGRSLMMADGHCVGVAGTLNGEEHAWPARAVLIADGGFQSNPDLYRKYIAAKPELMLQRGARNGRGDGLTMAMAVGADATGLNRFYGHLLCHDSLTNAKVWPYPELDGVASAGIVVGADGKRLVDEGLGGVTMTNHLAQLDDPTSTALIGDAAIWEGPGKSARIPANPLLERAGGKVYRADRLQDLATQLGLPAQALSETVAAYNAALKAGTPGALVPRRTTDTLKAWPIETPPFIAIRLCAGITNTMGGIVIDADGCVRRPDGSAIPGLYAAGAAIGGLEGPSEGEQVGYVGGLIKAVFALRAAEHLARSASGAAA